MVQQSVPVEAPGAEMSLATSFIRAMKAVAEKQDDAVAVLETCYGESMVFYDPVFALRDRASFIRLNQVLMRLASTMEMELHSVKSDNEELFASWTLRFKPRVGFTWWIEGTSHARGQDGRIYYHQDYWDIGTSVLRSLPLVGDWLRRRRLAR